MHRVGGAGDVFCGQDCPLLDSRFHGNDGVGVVSIDPLTLSLSKGEGFEHRTCRPSFDTLRMRMGASAEGGGGGKLNQKG